ncbi:hypothetical protein Tco_1122009 [Tanacetum coccineum]|uniref:Uncharacterized protein n=1 Tax=Tanacetum coccineum TaxID=301880 RepID=A0ABQ5J338_9ASTR
MIVKTFYLRLVISCSITSIDIVPADSSSSIPADYVSAGHVLVPADRDRICCLLFIDGYMRWAVKARFGGNEESKKMRKTMLKQQFTEFSVTEEEGLHKGYDRFQKILSQLNQVQARPDNDDINLKFLRALPSSWSQVGLALKTRGGLDSMSFDDLYNKLRSLELDVRIGHSYSVKAAVAPTHSAFIGTTCSGSKPTYSDQQRIVPSVSQTSGRSDNLMECVLHSFVAENDQDQDMIYEDFDQVDQLEMEEMDLKWQMAMLSLRINRFEKKAGRKMNYNNQQPARFDRRKVRYSAFKVTEVKSDEPKALVSVDSMVNWSDHAADNKTGEVEKVYGMMAGLHADNGGADASDAAAEFAMMGISPKAYQNAVKTLESQKDWYHKTQMALEEKIRVLTANLENTTNTLSYTETLHDQAQKEKKEWEVKYEATLARFEKWSTLVENEVFDLSRLLYLVTRNRVCAGALNPLYQGLSRWGDACSSSFHNLDTYMPSPDKSSDSATYASCDSSLKTKTKDFPPAVGITTLPESDVEDPNSTTGSPNSVPCKSQAAFVPAGSSNSSASVTADENLICASRKDQQSFCCGRPKLQERLTPVVGLTYDQHIFLMVWTVLLVGLNPAARPYSGPSSVTSLIICIDPNVYDPMYMTKGRWGTAVKTSAGYSWRNKRSQFWGPKSNGGRWYSEFLRNVISTPSASQNYNQNKMLLV